MSAFLAVGFPAHLQTHGQLKLPIDRGYQAIQSYRPDGQRFLMTKTADQQQAALTQINVVLNWFEELKQKVPVK